MTQEDKECIISWFQRIVQIATNRKTLNGEVMKDWEALNEISAIAKDSVYYIKNYCK